MRYAVRWFPERFLGDMRTTQRARLAKIGAQCVREIKTEMEKPKSGAKPSKGGSLYWQRRRARKGEAPAVQTGKLMESVQHRAVRELKERVYTRVYYGQILESLGYRWLKKTCQKVARRFLG